jgi:hypothetical protein
MSVKTWDSARDVLLVGGQIAGQLKRLHGGQHFGLGGQRRVAHPKSI